MKKVKQKYFNNLPFIAKSSIEAQILH